MHEWQSHPRRHGQADGTLVHERQSHTWLTRLALCPDRAAVIIAEKQTVRFTNNVRLSGRKSAIIRMKKCPQSCSRDSFYLLLLLQSESPSGFHFVN